MRNKKSINCYFISDLTSEKSLIIRETIERFDVGIFDPSDLIDAKSISEATLRLIKEADFVVAAFGPSNPKPSILFELGVAVGINKTLFIIADDSNEIPFPIKTLQQSCYSIKNLKAFEFALKVMLDTRKNKSINRDIKQSKALDTNKFPTLDLLEKLKSASETNSETKILSVIEEVFKKSNVTSIFSGKANNLNEDFVVWANDLEDVFGNPIIVELKIRLDSKEAVMNCENQIQFLLETRKAKAAIVLTFKLLDNQLLARYGRAYNIVFFELNNFIESIGEIGLEQTVREQRNAIARIRRSEG